MEQWETELVEKVRALAHGPFADRAARIDREGSFPAENVAELKALGIPGMALPRSLGGLGVSVETQLRVTEEIAYGDGSTAVALNMHILIADFLSFLPPFPRRNAVLEDVARNSALICGPGSVPTGELDSRRAGYRMREDGDHLIVDGRAGFASMSEGATYVMIGATVDRGEGNEADVALALPRTSDAGLRILNNWDAMGMRGTASHDIVCEGLVVPKSEALVIPAALMKVLAQGQVGGLTQDRARGALGILAIWLGLAQAAFDLTVAYVRERHGYLATPDVGGAPVGFRAEEPWAQLGLGAMEHWLETGRAVLGDLVRRLDRPFPSPQQFTRAMVRTVYHLRRMGEEVAMGSMRVCGAHAYVRSRPLERVFRDLMGGNVMAWKTDQLLQTLGQGALGMPISIVGPAGT
ncbi:MAG: acyl-CoA/acyl-ACP dehydrogenase [Dehalococcoidia bacterium]|nr:acyl-CoA/acyl-ACP dehydrogenase [Dehalococcoidia bacterium]